MHINVSTAAERLRGSLSRPLRDGGLDVDLDPDRFLLGPESADGFHIEQTPI